jgi:hypothetical protein
MAKGWRVPVLFSGETEAVNWWEAGGATGIIAAYQPKGAADIAASYINLANPGTYNAATGVEPTFDTATGWTFNGSDDFLTTSVIPDDIDWTLIVQFANHTAAANKIVSGVYDAATQNLIIQDTGTGIMAYQGGNNTANAGAMTAGNYAVAGKTAYRDGVAEANLIAAGGTAPTRAVYIGGLNQSGALSQQWAGEVIAVAIYNNTLSAGQVAAVATAMAAL